MSPDASLAISHVSLQTTFLNERICGFLATHSIVSHSVFMAGGEEAQMTQDQESKEKQVVCGNVTSNELV